MNTIKDRLRAAIGRLFLIQTYPLQRHFKRKDLILKRLLPHILPLLIITGLILGLIFTIGNYESRKSAAEINLSPNNPDSCSSSGQGQPGAGEKMGPDTNPGFLPIFMYHEIGNGPNGLYVSVDNFRTQMHYLRDNGYHAVTMEQAQAELADNNVEPMTIAITFDDGYLSFYTQAWPVLQECGFTATVYVCSSFAGRRNYLNWDQLKELQNDGVEIGSHTRTHPSLKTLNYDRLVWEIQGSKQILEQNLGVPVTSFCYPSGAFNGEAVAVVKQSGYTSAVTTNNMTANYKSDLFQLPRLRISRDTTITYIRDRLGKQ